MDFNRTISPDDHMATSDTASYFRTSLSAFDCILKSLASCGVKADSIQTILDFGCGYGRVYRALAAGFPHAQLTACDLMKPGAQFCAETFGGDWVQSHETLELVTLPRTYDLVWLGSVFTHLPIYRWCYLLDFLAGATIHNSIVVFTTHGKAAMTHMENSLLKRNRHIIEADRFSRLKGTIERTGFDFVPVKPKVVEIQKDKGMAVSVGEYGFSFAVEWWIRCLIERSQEWELVDYAAPGWGGNHDSVTLRRR